MPSKWSLDQDAEQWSSILEKHHHYGNVHIVDKSHQIQGSLVLMTTIISISFNLKQRSMVLIMLNEEAHRQKMVYVQNSIKGKFQTQVFHGLSPIHLYTSRPYKQKKKWSTPIIKREIQAIHHSFWPIKSIPVVVSHLHLLIYRTLYLPESKHKEMEN